MNIFTEMMALLDRYPEVPRDTAWKVLGLIADLPPQGIKKLRGTVTKPIIVKTYSKKLYGKKVRIETHRRSRRGSK